MEQSLSSATAAPFRQKKKIFVSDWNGALQYGGELNNERLTFLSDAAKAGHQVIIIAQQNMQDVTISLNAFLRSLRRRDHDAANIGQFRILTKADFEKENIKPDYYFTDDPSKKFYQFYMGEVIGSTLSKESNASSELIAQLRKDFSIPTYKKIMESSPTRAPAFG